MASETLTPTPSITAEAPSRFSRRSFMLRGVSSLAALLVAPQLLNGCGSSSEILLSPAQPAPAALPLDTLQSLLDGPLLRPNSPGFAQAARPWNLRYADRLPAAIARCATLDDIGESLAWAQDNGVPFVTRSGGHSYSGFSTTPGLLIDVSQMRSVDYNLGSGRLKVGPGAQNNTVYDNLREPSRSVTHGRCLRVGVAGLALGGGIGFNMRLHGLTCDQLVETDILLADGRHLTLNENQNSDLFWAVRGAGGGNFGIHTSLTFQTFAVSQLTYFKIDWKSGLDELFPLLMSLLAAAPRELGIKLAIIARRGAGGQIELTLNLLGQLVGTPEELGNFLAPAYAVATPSEQSIQQLDYWDAQKLLSEEGAPEFSFERSHCADAPLSSQGMANVLERLRAWPGLDGFADWKIFLCGGKVADVAPDATAYVHRRVFGITATELEWEGTESPERISVNKAWLDDFHQSMAQYTSNRSYQNFIDENQRDYLRAYYGANLERLVSVKAKYDPGNVFHYAQSIPVAL